MGSNSVIIRTELGLSIWSKVVSGLKYCEIAIEKIMEAQYIDWRLNHFCYGRLKERELEKTTGQTITLNTGVKTDRIIVEYRDRWRAQLQMLRSGEAYRKDSEKLKKQMARAEKKKNMGVVQKFISRGYHFIKRRIRRRGTL